MATYDSINLNEPAQCPHCGQVLSGVEFQTKSIEEYRCYHHFNFPDILEEEPYSSLSQKLKKKKSKIKLRNNFEFKGNTCCDACGNLFRAELFVENKIIYKIVIKSSNPDIKTQVFDAGPPSKYLYNLIKDYHTALKDKQLARDALTALTFMIYDDNQINLKGLRKIEKALDLKVETIFKDLFSLREQDWSKPFNPIIYKLQEYLDLLKKPKKKS